MICKNTAPSQQSLAFSSWIVLIWLFAAARTFSVTPLHSTRGAGLKNAYFPPYSATRLQVAHFDFTPNEMEELIISISQEPTDESRRQRMKSLFDEALAERHSERFTSLFDQVLIIVGDRVQIQAQEKALEETETAIVSDYVSSSNNNKLDFMAGKSAEQRQLWALVDMMVQSKIIVKRASDDLGNKGSFQ